MIPCGLCLHWQLPSQFSPHSSFHLCFPPFTSIFTFLIDLHALVCGAVFWACLPLSYSFFLVCLDYVFSLAIVNVLPFPTVAVVVSVFFLPACWQWSSMIRRSLGPVCHYLDWSCVNMHVYFSADTRMPHVRLLALSFKRGLQTINFWVASPTRPLCLSSS